MITVVLAILFGSLLTVALLLVGIFIGSQGKSDKVTPDLQKKITQIFRKVVPDHDLGGIKPLSQRQIDLSRNPIAQDEEDVMTLEFDKLLASDE